MQQKLSFLFNCSSRELTEEKSEHLRTYSSIFTEKTFNCNFLLLTSSIIYQLEACKRFFCFALHAKSLHCSVENRLFLCLTCTKGNNRLRLQFKIDSTIRTSTANFLLSTLQSVFRFCRDQNSKKRKFPQKCTRH